MQPLDEFTLPNLQKVMEQAPVLRGWADQPSPSTFIGVLKLIGEILAEETSPTRPDISVGVMPGLPNPKNLPLTKVMTSGKPTPVYHGTPKAFKEFDLSKAEEHGSGLYGPGIYFTESPRVASEYAAMRPVYGQANVRPAYLDITNPFDVEALVTSQMVQQVVKGIQVAAAERGWWSPGTPKAYIQEWAEGIGKTLTSTKTANQLYRRLARELGDDPTYPAKDWANQALQAAGYDGITYPGGKVTGGEPHRVWVIFQPKQAVSPYEYKAWLEKAQHRD